MRLQRLISHIIALLVITGVLAGCGGGKPLSTTKNTKASSQKGSAFNNGKTYLEITDNHLGTPVFSSADGAAVPNRVPARIPFKTRVHVLCVAPNTSGMVSVNAFYLITGGKWNRMYAPANTFANGGPLGPNPYNIDKRVPKCK